MSSHAPPTGEADTPATIRDRGAIGAVLLTVRDAAAQAVAFAGTLVLAHQLSPRTFGLVAFGATVVVIGDFLADGGLGAALTPLGEPTVSAAPHSRAQPGPA